MIAEDRRRVKVALDAHQRERLGRSHSIERKDERESRYFEEKAEPMLLRAAEHVPPMTERQLASLCSRRLR